MKWAEIILIIEEDEELTEDDMENIDIEEAVIALEEQLPKLPKGAKWKVSH